MQAHARFRCGVDWRTKACRQVDAGAGGDVLRNALAHVLPRLAIFPPRAANQGDAPQLTLSPPVGEASAGWVCDAGMQMDGRPGGGYAYLSKRYHARSYCRK